MKNNSRIIIRKNQKNNKKLKSKPIGANIAPIAIFKSSVNTNSITR